MVKEEFFEQEVSGRGHKRSAEETFNQDISKVLIELITNSCDSYKRVETEIDKKIINIVYNKSKRIIKVIDNGEGINFNKKNGENCFRDIMKKGELTGGRERGIAVRGFHGIGLKDVCIAMENVHITSIKNKKITIIDYGYNNKKKNYGYWPIKKDEVVMKEEKAKFGIEKDGFYIEFKISKEWNAPFPTQLYNKLQTHRELRKILENKEFKIYLNGEALTYSAPKGEIVDSGLFNIRWKAINFKINYVIKIAEDYLSQSGTGWVDRIGGLLIYHSKDAVLDLTLFKFNNDIYASKIFGDAEIITENIEDMNKLLEDGLVDEKRRGLDFRKEFNEKLKQVFDEKLKIIVDKEKSKGKDKNIIDEESQKILNSINNLIKSEIGKAITDSSDVPSWRPVDKPFGFFPSNTTTLIKEFEKRNIYLIINKKLLTEDELNLESSEKKIDIKPKKIIIKKESFDKEGYLLKKIYLYSESKDCMGILTASTESYNESIDIKVIENEKLNPEGGFSFVPNKIKIAKNIEKEIDLTFDERIIKFGNEIKISINSEEIKIKKAPNKIQKHNTKKLVKDVYVLKIKLYSEKIGASAKISAIVGNKITEAFVEVVEEREIKRKNYLENIKFSEIADPIAISKYEENEKTIWVFLNHPVILQHRRNIGEDIKILSITHQDIILLLADNITRVISSLMAKEYNKKVIGEMQISSYNDFELTFNEMYRKHGTNLSKATYDIVVNYMNKKIEDQEGEIELLKIGDN